jgi:hypothetical protein
MLGAALYDKCPTGAIPKPGKDAIVSQFLRIYNKATESAVYAYEHPAIETRLVALDTVVEPPARGRLLREIGEHKFQEFADMPLFWLYAEAGVHPQYVAEYIFPGSITGFFTHLEYVKLAP